MRRETITIGDRTAYTKVDVSDYVLSCEMGADPDACDIMILARDGGPCTVTNRGGDAFDGEIVSCDLDKCVITVTIGEPS